MGDGDLHSTDSVWFSGSNSTNRTLPSASSSGAGGGSQCSSWKASGMAGRKLTGRTRCFERTVCALSWSLISGQSHNRVAPFSVPRCRCRLAECGTGLSIAGSSIRPVPSAPRPLHLASSFRPNPMLADSSALANPPAICRSTVALVRSRPKGTCGSGSLGSNPACQARSRKAGMSPF
jgi:hypothetical protein